MPVTADMLVARFNDQQTLPHVAIRVNQLIQDDNATMQDFEDVVKLDPVLVTRLLRLINSAFFSLPTKVESISKAIIFLGMKNLRNLVSIEAVKNLFRGEERPQGFSRKNLWLHSATVAVLGQMIARRIFGLPGEDFFLAGILHDIGIIVEHQVLPAELEAAFEAYEPGKHPLIACEQEFVGADHCQVGARLGKDFQVEKSILQAVAHHHDEESRFAMNSPVCVIQIADYLASNLNYSPYPGKADPAPEFLAHHLRSRKADYRVLIKDLPAQMAQARDLYEI